MEKAEPEGSNRLINEKSPYLLQHADNPVDWYPWGDEAFEKAKRENKPVLVSIGYATCHWCHVMAEESFSDHKTAGIMNRELVNIKIDREERPDLDQIYITAVSALTGSAGWPLNVFLTPDAKPFFGGTYFPPQKRFSIPSWSEVVLSVSKAWQDADQMAKLLESAEKITLAVKEHLNASGAPSDNGFPDAGVVHDAAAWFYKSYDGVHGGFSRAPKFPMPGVLDFLLFYHKFVSREGQTDATMGNGLEMAVHTMRQMANGGIYDHVGGGFHRYSTDEDWHVPHFEKMLYDNAQLIKVYLKAYEITGEESLARTAIHSLEYIFREMTDPRGGFYSAQDADSPSFDLSAKKGDGQKGRKAEGVFYTWGKDEIEAILDKESGPVFSYHFDIRAQGNAEADPLGEFAGRNILHQPAKIEDTAAHFGISTERAVQAIQSSLSSLLSARYRRPKPHLDDKILLDWNALMISALAEAGRVLGDEKYLLRAKKAVAFINENMAGRHGGLYRRLRDTESAISGLAGDYAYFVRALLDMHGATGNIKYLKQAAELGGRMLDLFYDDKDGGFFMTGPDHDPHLIFRAKDFTDGVLPAAGSVAVMDCIRLFEHTNDKRFLEAARRSFTGAGKRLKNQPQAMPQLVAALGYFHNTNKGKEM
ncbi:MAG: thioredoxin domain-containing protein [Desulfobacteraceae bacterium]|nr:thioredoxin domain-containing protein [Desulfobacteraceae bacterium]